MAARGIVLVTALMILVAGCVEAGGTTAGSNEPPPANPAALGDPASLTGVRGIVQNDEFVPILGASVQVDDLAPVTTGEDGVFEVRGLEPGRHRLIAQALGYTSVGRHFEVAADQIADVTIQLANIPIQTPYTELVILDGYDVCSYAVFAFIGSAPNPCPLGARKGSFPLNLSDSWRYFVTETAWPSSESFWVSINPAGAGCTTGNPCPGVEISRSPLRLEGAPQDPALAARYALDGKRMYENGTLNLAVFVAYAGYLREEINGTAPTACTAFWGSFGVAARLGCPLGFGYSLGIRFKQYHSVFHWERPSDPGKYSGMPDA